MKWTPEAEAALQDLKRFLSSMLILVAPKLQEPLLLYLAATNQVVSVALVVQREVDEEAVAVARLSDDGPELPLVGPGAGEAGPLAESGIGKTGAPAEPGTSKIGSQPVSEVVQRKKMMQHPV